MLIYATDLDRTLIYSKRFLKEYPYDKEIKLVEKKDDKEISYMAQLVYDKLQEVSNSKEIRFIPVSSRSLEEYSRVKLGFTPEWAVVANGGLILHKGEPVQEYSSYVKSYLNPMDMASLSLDLSDFRSASSKPRIVDGCYLFMKTDNPELFDLEVADIEGQYNKWSFTRQRSKCYIIPNHISKQIALRWLWNKLNKPYIVASGDSLLDVPMLALANKAYIPQHASLISDKIVEDGNIIKAGIDSPYETMCYVEAIAKTKA